MALKSRCVRATDGSEIFLLSIGRGGVPPVYVLNRANAEDLIQEITSAVRSYDDAHRDDTIALAADPTLPGDDGPEVA